MCWKLRAVETLVCHNVEMFNLSENWGFLNIGIIEHWDIETFAYQNLGM